MLYVEVDMLVTLEQYQQLFPDTLACYVPFGTLIIYQKIAVPLSHISGVCQRPLSLLRWERSSGTLEQVCQQVKMCLYLATCTFKNLFLFLSGVLDLFNAPSFT